MDKLIAMTNTTSKKKAENVDAIVHEVERATLNIKILDCPNIITLGYSCICHYQDKKDKDLDEIEIHFDENLLMRDEITKQYKPKKFVKAGSTIKVDCCFKKSSEKIKCAITENTRFILRSDDMTIGFGKPIFLSK